MVIAIDGPAGAGKSSVARAVARALGFTYLDSGAMYRSVALAAMRDGRPAEEIAPQVRIELGDGRVELNGEDVTDSIRRQIYIFNAKGKFLRAIGDGRLLRPTGMVLDSAARRIYVADTLRHQVLVLGLDGTLEVRVVGLDASEEELLP